MKKIFLFGCLATPCFFVNAQHGNFETPSLAPETAAYGQDQVTDGDTIYTNGDYHFETNYNAGWGSYAGWAFSNITDHTTAGWGNQFSAITGTGEGGSSQYGVCFASAWNNNRIFNTGTSAQTIQGFYVTNTTYAYYAMLNGDDFTKPFGADTNALGIIDGTNGEDWFLLTIFGLDEDSLYTGDSVNFYLADFRYTDSANDYIIDEWTWVDLSSLGPVKGLDFVMSSSDTSGGFGMNNPAYFAADNLYGAFAETAINKTVDWSVYPNPACGVFKVEAQAGSQLIIYSVDGREIQRLVLTQQITEIVLGEVNSGILILDLYTTDGLVSRKKLIQN